MKNLVSNINYKIILSSSLMGIQQLLIGCTYVFTSTLFSQLQKSTSTLQLSTEETSWIASISILICPCGLLLIGILSDKIGRRKALQIFYIPMILSWLTLAYADSYITILIGRIILGISLGSGACVYLYLAETCPTPQRPFFNSMVSLLIGIGNILETSLGELFHWNTVSLTMAVASAASCVSLYLIPEPPSWLRARDRIAEAEAAERWFGVEDAAAETKPAPAAETRPAPAAETRPAPPTVDAAAGPHWWSVYTRRVVWKPALITLAFFTCQQCSGIFALMFYATEVLRDCGVSWDGGAVTVFLFGARVVSCVAYALLHRVRRKTLATASSAGMAASLAVVLAHMRWSDGDAGPSAAASAPLLVAAFTVYVVSTQIGILPMPWSLCGEVFPMAVKGTMNGIVQTYAFILMFTVTKIHPIMVTTLGVEYVWCIYTLFCVLSVLFSLFILPETQGVPLDVILSNFESRSKKKTTTLNLSSLVK